MAHVNNGVLAVLSHPQIYRAFQNLMGAERLRKQLVSEFVRPVPGQTILDIGCGPADILNHLPQVNYFGFDISRQYIEQAKGRFGNRGQFFCQPLAAADLKVLPKAQLVFAFGLLHHLSDSSAEEVLQLAFSALAPGGRLITFDPCYEPGQHPLAKFLIARDRGHHVRHKAGYQRLVETAFQSPRVEIQHARWIPYTRCIMECFKRDEADSG
jgi:SAM-dependent methyltransferase